MKFYPPHPASKVEFKADSLHLPLLRLAREGSRLMSVHGQMEFRCRPDRPAGPVAFASGESYLVSQSRGGGKVTQSTLLQ